MDSFSIPALPTILQGVQYAQPTVGQTVTVSSLSSTVVYNQCLVVDPAGLLLTLTIALPATAPDSSTVNIMCTQAVTTLTMSVATIVGALAGFTINSFACYVCRSNIWYRIG